MGNDNEQDEYWCDYISSEKGCAWTTWHSQVEDSHFQKETKANHDPDLLIVNMFQVEVKDEGFTLHLWLSYISIYWAR